MSDSRGTSRIQVRLQGPYTWPAAVVIGILVTAGWVARDQLRGFFWGSPASWISVAIGLVVVSLSLAAVLWVESETLRRRWRQRVRHLTGMERLVPTTWWRRQVASLPDPLELVANPIARTMIGNRLAQEWYDAGLGSKASRYYLLLGAVALLGWLVGNRIGGGVLSLALAGVFPLIPSRVIAQRAERTRRRFGEQLPQTLEALSAGMSAGLSFQQAVDYAGQELSEPMTWDLKRLSRRMTLGHPVDQALHSWRGDRDDEALALVVEGIALQRQLGGDMVRMLDEMADLLRERVELEQEVRAVATQGRLSGNVIGALVPVSAGVLLILNPSYIDVFFETIIGQILVVFVIALQLIGWAIIARLMRIEY